MNLPAPKNEPHQKHPDKEWQSMKYKSKATKINRKHKCADGFEKNKCLAPEWLRFIKINELPPHVIRVNDNEGYG